MQGMRRIFALLDIPIHAELTAGLAWQEFAALNVYQSIHAPTMPTTVCHQSEYLVYTPGDKLTRWIPRAEHWKVLKVWESCGQEDRSFDWKAEGIVQAANINNVLASIGITRPADMTKRDSQQMRRMYTMMRHLDPYIQMPEDRRIEEAKGKGKGTGILALTDDYERKGLKELSRI